MVKYKHERNGTNRVSYIVRPEGDHDKAVGKTGCFF